MAVAIHFGAFAGVRAMPRSASLGIATFLIICILQLVPLPPGLWTHLPGQETRVAVLAQVGLGDAWMPMSMTPFASLYGVLLALAVAVALCGLLELSERDFRLIVGLLVVIVLIGLVIGVVQVSSAGRMFRFYTAIDDGALIGLYANKNHMALVMACSIAFARMLMIAPREGGDRRHNAFLGYWAFIVLALPMTNSRAGLIFGALMSAVVLWTLLVRVSGRARVATVAVLALGVSAGILFLIPTSLLDRFDSVTEDVRWPILQHSVELWRQYWIFGSGLGSFADVYMSREKLEWLFPNYVNNVHNDYVQLGIELGIAGLVAVALFGAGILQSILSAPRIAGSWRSVPALMGFAVVLMFALHSAFDYPLRRPAAIVMFIVAVAAVFRESRPLADKSGRADVVHE